MVLLKQSCRNYGGTLVHIFHICTEEDTRLADKIENSFRPEGCAINVNSLNIWDNLKSARRLSGFTNFSLIRLLYLDISIVQCQEISR